jgi:hypothetical protein
MHASLKLIFTSLSLLLLVSASRVQQIQQLQRECPLNTFHVNLLHSSETEFRNQLNIFEFAEVARMATKEELVQPGESFFSLGMVYIRGYYFGTYDQLKLNSETSNRLFKVVRCQRIAHLIELIWRYPEGAVVPVEQHRTSALPEGVLVGYNLNYSPLEDWQEDPLTGNIDIVIAAKGIHWSSYSANYKMVISVNNQRFRETFDSLEEASQRYDLLKLTSVRNFDVNRTLNARLFPQCELTNGEIEEAIENFEERQVVRASRVRATGRRRRREVFEDE